MHLHAHSWYSFLAGTLSVARLVEHASRQGMPWLALTDTNNVTGATEFVTACRARGIRPVTGAELRLRADKAVALARSWDGYQAICSAVTRVAALAPPARIFEEKEAAREEEGEQDGDGALAAILADELDEQVLLLSRDPALLAELHALRPELALYLELLPADEASWRARIASAAAQGISPVAACDVYFGEPGGRELHRLLRAIASNRTLATLDEAELGSPQQYFWGEEAFRSRYRDVPEALRNRDRIAEQCNADFDFTTSKFASWPEGDAAEKRERLRALAEEGCWRRYPSVTAIHRRRIEKELGIITSLGFTDYYLVAWDIVRYARSRNYPYVGRGSGANSIVAYCLDITNVDPVELDLFFERFLNPERRSPPDFDIDFSWKVRDDVIAYALEKYDPSRTAMICTISTFNPRGALRDVGKVMGFSDAEIRQLTSVMPGYAGARDMDDPASPLYRQTGIVTASPYGRRWIHAAKRILDFPNHYGIHSGGVILAPERMTRYTATQVAPKGVRVTQQDMFGMEDWRLEKLDLLSTRGLGTFDDTMRAVELRTGARPPVDDYRVACADEETRRIMREGRTIGCFYIESPAMIQLLKKLRTDTFEMLTAASSIIRPGVAQSGMMQAFIERYHDPGKIRPPHPLMQELLASTFGVMVYQEDVIKVAHFIGKLSLGEADLLRRAMSGKMRSREAMMALRDAFARGCSEQGIPADAVAEIWRQMESFAGYSFCKAHSASYAVLSFQEAYLKAHAPALFLCSVLNNQGGYYRPDVYIQEAKRLGLRMLLPHVNASGELHHCPDEHSIQLGFLHVKGLTAVSVQAVMRNRGEGGPYASFSDLLRRGGAQYEDLRLLVRCGACDGLGEDRPAMLVRARIAFRAGRGQRRQEELPLPEPDFGGDLALLHPYTPEQITQIELDTFSYTVSSHVLDHFAAALAGTVRSPDLDLHIGRNVAVGGWMIAAKITRTRKGERMMFMNLDDAVGTIDVVLFPRCFASFGHLLRTAGPYRIEGRVAEQYGVISVVARTVEKLGEG